MIPTFKMHGSKARSAAWVCSLFPRRFERLFEPFAGRGNIFFRACNDCAFNRAYLNDLNSAPFLGALRDYEGDYSFVDEGPIGRSEWERWRDSEPSMERALAESYVARFGSSFSIGPATAGGDSANGHSKPNTIRRMKAAQRLLREKRAEIHEGGWKVFLGKFEFGPKDLIYLDPPYDVPQQVHYTNIDQDDFLSTVLDLRGRTGCSVYVSGYTSERYERALTGWSRETKTRASTGKGVAHSGASGNKPRVEEVVWYSTSEEREDVLRLFS